MVKIGAELPKLGYHKNKTGYPFWTTLYLCYFGIYHAREHTNFARMQCFRHQAPAVWNSFPTLLSSKAPIADSN